MFSKGEHCDFDVAGTSDHLHVEDMGKDRRIPFEPSDATGGGSMTLKVDSWCQIPAIVACLAGDPPGSTITFGLFELPDSMAPGSNICNGDVDVLEQVGHAPDAGVITNRIAPGIAYHSWRSMAQKIAIDFGEDPHDITFIGSLSSAP